MRGARTRRRINGDGSARSRIKSKSRSKKGIICDSSVRRLGRADAMHFIA